MLKGNPLLTLKVLSLKVVTRLLLQKPEPLQMTQNRMQLVQKLRLRNQMLSLNQSLLRNLNHHHPHLKVVYEREYCILGTQNIQFEIIVERVGFDISLI